MKNPLGNEVEYPTKYSPEILFPIERSSYRALLDTPDVKPEFDEQNATLSGTHHHAVQKPQGWDVWRCYEFSWLQSNRPPAVAVLGLVIPSYSPRIIESKSLKLYLGSFAQTQFDSIDSVRETIELDLSARVGSSVFVSLQFPADWDHHLKIAPRRGVCIDQLPVKCSIFSPSAQLIKRRDFSLDSVGADYSNRSENSSFLRLNEDKNEGEASVEWWYSDLLRTLCPVTQQPDWASVEIGISGGLIDPNSLLEYLVSFREHLGFHEECCERIFSDLQRVIKPSELCVVCSFTRRGGIDITPVRHTPSENWLIEELSARRSVRQ